MNLYEFEVTLVYRVSPGQPGLDGETLYQKANKQRKVYAGERPCQQYENPNAHTHACEKSLMIFSSDEINKHLGLSVIMHTDLSQKVWSQGY